jgi:hypothetical protein
MTPVDTARRTGDATRATLCHQCDAQLERHILFGGLRFYVCRACGAWAVPFPPEHASRTSADAG